MADLDSGPVCTLIHRRVQEQLVHPCENISLVLLPRSLLALVIWCPGTHFQTSEVLGRFTSVSVLVSNIDI